MVRAGILAFSALLLGACEAVPDAPMADLAFDSSSGQALLLQHRDSWLPIYERVDLATGRTLPGVMPDYNPNTTDVAYAGRVSFDERRATPQIREELGIETILLGQKSGGYIADLAAPGDYALIGLTQANSNGYAGWVNIRCFTGAAPVFHLEAGRVSILEAGNRKNARADKGNDNDPAAAAQDVKLGRFLMDGYPQVHAEVQLAPFVTRIQYGASAEVQDRFNPCPRAGFFRPAPKADAPVSK